MPSLVMAQQNGLNMINAHAYRNRQKSRHGIQKACQNTRNRISPEKSSTTVNADGTNIDEPLHMSDKEYAHIMQSFYRNVATHKR